MVPKETQQLWDGIIHNPARFQTLCSPGKGSYLYNDMVKYLSWDHGGMNLSMDTP